MDFPLSSSVILVVAVVLWIVWVAPYVLRNRRHQFQAAGDFLADTPDETPDMRAGLVLKVAARQEEAMDTRKSTGSATATASAGPAGRFRIRYGRTAIALAGLLSLLTAFVSTVLLLFGLGTSLLPLVCVTLAVASVALLRGLAVRDRKAKVNAAFRSAMSAPIRQAGTDRIPPKPPAAPVRADSPLFDAEAEQPKVKPLTAMELREAALAVAVAAGDASAAKAAQPAAIRTWEPVEVPRPVYVEAAKAERPAPEPLDLPEAPKATGKPSLKQGAAAPATTAPEVPQNAKAQSALSNLDDVLQRRRA